MKIDIKKLGKRDIAKFNELIWVFEDVFEMDPTSRDEKPSDEYLNQLLRKKSFFVFVAIINQKVVGGLTAYTLQQYYSISPLVYLYDLAVASEFQRQGIGKMLISSLLNYCKGIGIEEVFVQADEIDSHAIDFYHSTGGIGEKCVNFNYPLKT